MGMNTNNAGLAGKHINLSHQYGCRAWMTVATFVANGIVHRARRFFRADMLESGKIELYTIESYPGAENTSMTEVGWYESTFSEDWLGYANPGTAVARRAEAALNAIDSLLAADQSERFAQIELA